jgi:hypothetical protein
MKIYRERARERDIISDEYIYIQREREGYHF